MNINRTSPSSGVNLMHQLAETTSENYSDSITYEISVLQIDEGLLLRINF